MRGKVIDAQGKPVAGRHDPLRGDGRESQDQTKTDKNGDFLQVGLASGATSVTASKDKVGTQTLKLTVRQGPNNPLTFALTHRRPDDAPADKAEAAAMQALAGQAVDAMKAGRHDEAIAKFNEVIVKVPTCVDCYYNIGVAHAAKQQYTEAEAAFKKAIELKPESGRGVYRPGQHLQRAEEVRSRAEASANASKYAGAGGGGAGAEASYNQGVILWNAGKFAEAKVQFEAAVKADPTMGMAHYQLGMANLNLGQIPEARAVVRGVSEGRPERPEGRRSPRHSLQAAASVGPDFSRER